MTSSPIYHGARQREGSLSLSEYFSARKNVPIVIASTDNKHISILEKRCCMLAPCSKKGTRQRGKNSG